ncbi:MAG TPA: Dabb family protein [Bacteroidales bacterium]
MKKSAMFKPFWLFLFGIIMFTNCQRSDDAGMLPVSDVKSESNALKCGKVETHLRHLLLFQFNDNTSPAVKRMFTKALVSFKDSIKEVKGLEWGINFNSASSGSYSYCFLLTFNSQDDFLSYVANPVHTNFITKWLNPNIKDLIAFDYMATEVKTDFSKGRSKPLRHMDLVNYNDNLLVETKNDIIESFTKLADRTGAIQKAEWGSELLLLGLNKNLDDAFLFTFEHPGDYYSFLHNPLTKYFYNNEITPNAKEVLTIDYLANIEE